MSFTCPRRRRFRDLGSLLLGLGLFAGAQLLPAPALGAAQLRLMEGSALWLEGDSTLHPYSSTATAVDLTVRFATSPTDMAPLAFIQNHPPEEATLSVPVHALRSGSRGLDRNMAKHLRAEEHPAIIFRLTEVAFETEKEAEEGAARALTMRGQLEVAGVEQPVTIAGAISAQNGHLRLTGQTDVLMSDFGIKPPTMFLGAVKTRDEIRIGFDLHLAP